MKKAGNGLHNQSDYVILKSVGRQCTLPVRSIFMLQMFKAADILFSEPVFQALDPICKQKE
jgi:hypothetical protein